MPLRSPLLYGLAALPSDAVYRVDVLEDGVQW